MTIEQTELPEVADLIERRKQRFESELARTEPNDIGDHYYNWAKTLLNQYSEFECLFIEAGFR